eukprot:349667-Chlamydomonas_euryale.AAC.6
MFPSWILSCREAFGVSIGTALFCGARRTPPEGCTGAWLAWLAGLGRQAVWAPGWPGWLAWADRPYGRPYGLAGWLGQTGRMGARLARAGWLARAGCLGQSGCTGAWLAWLADWLGQPCEGGHAGAWLECTSMRPQHPCYEAASPAITPSGLKEVCGCESRPSSHCHGTTMRSPPRLRPEGLNPTPGPQHETSTPTIKLGRAEASRRKARPTPGVPRGLVRPSPTFTL